MGMGGRLIQYLPPSELSVCRLHIHLFLAESPSAAGCANLTRVIASDVRHALLTGANYLGIKSQEIFFR